MIALWSKKIYLALSIGILSGAMSLFILLHFDTNQFFEIIPQPFISLISRDNFILIAFTILLIILTQILILNNSLESLVLRLSHRIKTKAQAQLFILGSGLFIFFDDYANSLIVGNTLQPFANKFRISKAKLAYIVDSTAAPIASIAFVSTWVGFQVGEIQSSLVEIDSNISSYGIFLSSVQYSFYAFFTLSFIVLLSLSRKDFGKMYLSETTMNATDPIKQSQKQASATPAIVTLIALLFGTVSSMILLGIHSPSKNLIDIINHSDPFLAILIGAGVGFFVAILFANKRILVQASTNGIKTVAEPLVILVLSWTMGNVIRLLHIDENLSVIISGLELGYIPAISFLLAGLLSFATGTSFGTMSIMLPIVLPTYYVMNDGMIDELFYCTTATILSGAIFGDHCSPISDTTILSSAATNCNHIEHFQTQLPYALTVGAISVLALLLIGFQLLPLTFIYIFCLLLLYLIIRVFGKP